jgi:hypothetical protein
MPNTEYSRSCIVPPREPTMRSVRLIVLEKLSRMPERTFSMPISSATLSAMDATVSDVASSRFASDFLTSENRNISAATPC